MRYLALTAALVVGWFAVGPGRVEAAASSSPVGVRAGQLAERQVGKPYVWGADGPGAFDCSGLVGWAWRSAGADWPDATADDLARHWPHIPAARVRPGDLLVWDWQGDGQVDHVAVVTSRGRFVEAPARGVPVRVRAVRGSAPTAALRPGPAW